MRWETENMIWYENEMNMKNNVKWRGISHVARNILPILHKYCTPMLATYWAQYGDNIWNVHSCRTPTSINPLPGLLRRYVALGMGFTILPPSPVHQHSWNRFYMFHSSSNALHLFLFSNVLLLTLPVIFVYDKLLYLTFSPYLNYIHTIDDSNNFARSEMTCFGKMSAELIRIL